MKLALSLEPDVSVVGGGIIGASIACGNVAASSAMPDTGGEASWAGAGKGWSWLRERSGWPIPRFRSSQPCPLPWLRERTGGGNWVSALSSPNAGRWNWPLLPRSSARLRERALQQATLGIAGEAVEAPELAYRVPGLSGLSARFDPARHKSTRAPSARRCVPRFAVIPSRFASIAASRPSTRMPMGVEEAMTPEKPSLPLWPWSPPGHGPRKSVWEVPSFPSLSL